MRRESCLWLCAVLSMLAMSSTSLGCERKQSSESSATKELEAMAEAPESAPAPAAPPSGLDESELKRAVDAWVNAQNRGDFASYAALYAAKFYGVKRAGKRETHFDREGWLEDRKRMFQKPMQVKVSDLVLTPGAASARVELVQHFATGNFADVGPKRLMLVREGGSLKIAQEEMLSSETTSRESPSLERAYDFHFVLRAKGFACVVLPEVHVPEVTGAPELIDDVDEDPNVFSTRVPIAPSQLSADALAFQGARLRVDGRCEAQVQKLWLVSRVWPHFGEVQVWQNTYQDQPGGALSRAQQAAAAFELGEKSVCAQLSACHDGTYAQRPETPVPVGAESIEDEALADKARAAFSSLGPVRGAQKDFTREVPEAKGHWWDDSLAVSMFRHPSSRQTLAVVRASLETGGCSEFSASEWAVFELRGKRWQLLSESAQAGSIKTAFDVNADGRLEFLLEDLPAGSDALLDSPDAHGPSVELSYAYQDCPC